MKANKKKDTILKMLKENSDRYISGEELSEMFNVSRTAIWKNINDLRKIGYEIDSVTNRGYKLMSSPGILNAGETKTYIDDNALIGKELIVFETIDSTNTYLKSNAEKYPTGTVIASREQTGGKGRLGRVWQSKKDDTISFSVLLRPEISPMEVSAITPLCGLAVAKALNEYFNFGAEIKWPNDVIIGNKKLVGILTEMNCEFDKVDFIVVGIGINILNKDFPEEISKKATSCALESEKEIDKNKLLALILKHIENTLLKGNYSFNEENLKEYKDYCATLGRDIIFTRKGEKVSGKATDIDNNGELVVTLEDGTTETVFSGEVTVQGIY